LNKSPITNENNANAITNINISERCLILFKTAIVFLYSLLFGINKSAKIVFSTK